MVQDLHKGMEAAGIPVPDSQDRWAKALKALKVGPLAATLSLPVQLCTVPRVTQCGTNIYFGHK